MEVTERKSVFGNNQVEVTEKAAGRMGELYTMLCDRLMRQGLPPTLREASYTPAPLPRGEGRSIMSPSPAGRGVRGEGSSDEVERQNQALRQLAQSITGQIQSTF